ncbi:hypothetical protein LENED_003523 [Lentinula edodes]|uniref:BZIP domain-containing protein n=1 Tax=Lentinula edodes TaxID=5353 RepID=A0A1Q3E406_LENED|nr:hypothetical protein F5877DRAFT_77340 [Lentinula edodes]GAW01901.1 hypothetical protein LENED_003523 [Lentinula edodes]
MAEGTTERGYSNDPDSDGESREDSAPPGKPGRKKNPNSQAARRDQNRIAQREFRLRKQQRIRDLEARVEILSGGKEEAMGEMRNILKDLMQENQTLRSLLRSVSAFIGEGAGGLLPKLGWEMSDFNNFINRSETDTAWEGYQRRKKVTATTEILNPGQKRTADQDDSSTLNKKARTNDAADAGSSYSMLLPMSSSPITSTTLYQGPNSHDGRTMFSDIMRNSNGSPMFMSGSSSSTSPQYGGPSSSNVSGYPYIPGGHMNLESSLPPISFPPTPSVTNTQSRSSDQPSPEQMEDDEDPNKNEAYKLIHYHLDNFKRNSAYCLPSSLRPTLVQRTVPHESVIDRILHPELRDRMILLRTRFDLVDCLLEYRNAVTIHGDDVLAHSNWEINEKWLRKYGFLVEQATLNIMNRWRRERGEPELRLSDIASAEHSPNAV